MSENIFSVINTNPLIDRVDPSFTAMIPLSAAFPASDAYHSQVKSFWGDTISQFEEVYSFDDWDAPGQVPFNLLDTTVPTLDAAGKVDIDATFEGVDFAVMTQRFEFLSAIVDNYIDAAIDMAVLSKEERLAIQDLPVVDSEFARLGMTGDALTINLLARHGYFTMDEDASTTAGGTGEGEASADAAGGTAEPKKGFMIKGLSTLKSFMVSAGQWFVTLIKQDLAFIAQLFRKNAKMWERYGTAYTNNYPSIKGNKIKVVLALKDPNLAAMTEIGTEAEKLVTLIEGEVNKVVASAGDEGGESLTKIKEAGEAFTSKKSALSNKWIATMKDLPMPTPDTVRTVLSEKGAQAASKVVSSIGNSAQKAIKDFTGKLTTVKGMVGVKALKQGINAVKKMISAAIGVVKRAVYDMINYCRRAIKMGAKGGSNTPAPAGGDDADTKTAE